MADRGGASTGSGRRGTQQQEWRRAHEREQANLETVRRFCAAWSGRNPAEVAGYFAEDAVYHNIPMKPAQGIAEIRSFLDRFLAGATFAEFQVLQIGAAGDVVFTERVDRFSVDGRTIELPVAGVFELRDGRIAAWRDYFDLATWAKQSQAAQA